VSAKSNRKERLLYTECAHCGCDLLPTREPPHCEDCIVTEEDEERWLDALEKLEMHDAKK